jgi:hypothetical protein
MPRVSDLYAYPPGTPGVADTTIESADYNAYIDDIKDDLNLPRPIIVGGTGAGDAITALANLGGEKAKQVVTNYGSTPTGQASWLSGSFYSDAGATGAPTANAFIGFASVQDDNNMVLVACDLTDAVHPIYSRTKVGGVWSAWIKQATLVDISPKADKTYVDAQDALKADKTYVDAQDALKADKIYVDAQDALKADKTYADAQDALKVAKAGDTMTGDLTINKAIPTINLKKTAAGQNNSIAGYNNATARWVIQLGDSAAEGGADAGSDFTIQAFDDSGAYKHQVLNINRAAGLMQVKGDPTAALGVATKQYVDNRAVVLRNYIVGLRLQYTGATTFNVYAGQAASDDNTVMMTRPGNLAKTTAAWVAGNGGSLDTGTIGVGNWYHVFLIQRLDTGVTDILISLSLTAPTMPANYTKRRRIGTLLYNAGVLTSFLQDGDYFYWSVPFATPNAIATTPTLRGVYVPTGVSVVAMLNVTLQFPGASGVETYHWNPALGGGAINQGRLGITCGLTSTTGVSGSMQVRTDVNGQIYNYCGQVPTSYQGYTEGYIDSRGKDL